jgi:hypothetical protein
MGTVIAQSGTVHAVTETVKFTIERTGWTSQR